MHVAGLVEVAHDAVLGPVPAREFRRHVASRIRRLPRFRQRVEFDLFGFPRRWVDVGRVDLEAHLFMHRVHRAVDVAEVCGRLHGEPLPLDRPLWQMHLIDIEDDVPPRQLLMIKMHHAIADGVAGVHVSEALFDLGAGVPRPADVAAGHRFAGLPASPILAAGQALAGAGFTAAGGPIAIANAFNVKVGPERVVALGAVAIDDLASLKRRFGGSFDDAFLAVVALSLRRFSGSRRPLRALVPVSTWVPGRDAGTGNHVSTVFVDLPQDSRDIGSVMARIATQKSVLRSSHAAAGMSMLVAAAGLLPAPLQRAIVRTAASLPFANLVVSDVPGSEGELSLLGRPLVACYPLIPVSRLVGLSIAALTMNGVAGIGIVADPKALPHPERLAREIERTVRRLATASGRGRAAPAPARAA